MRLQLLLFTLLCGGAVTAQDFMFQGWYWDYPSTPCGGTSSKWATILQSKASALGNAGFTYAWLPPPAKGGGECSVGYDPKDLYDLGDHGPTRFGSRAQLNSLISALNGQGIEAVADVVYNHRDAGDWEDNPAVRQYILNYPSVGNACNNGVTPYPINGKVRWRLPVGGASGNGAGLYHFRFSSASAGAGFSGRNYRVHFLTSQVGWSGLSDETEVEPNNGAACGTPANYSQVTLGRKMQAWIDDPGSCNVDEFVVDLQVGDFAAAGDFLVLEVEEIGGGGTGIDIRPYAVYTGQPEENIYDELVLQTRTDFTNMPSGLGGMSYLNFKPNGIDPTCLEGDWDFPYFFFDVDQRQSSTQQVYNEWSKWLIDQAGFTGGLRMDAVKHFDPSMVTNLLNYLSDEGIEPGMIVGEIFDANIGRLTGWVDDVNTGLTADVHVRVFDFNLRDALKAASDQHYFEYFYDTRNVFNAGMRAAGADPFSIVTFVNNHDFRGPNEPVQDDPELAYAYILTNNRVGLPCVFYPDFFSDQPPNYPPTNLQTEITELMNLHQEHIFGATEHYYLNEFDTEFASNYISGNANQCLVYQISGGPSGKDVVVAINFDDEPLRVNHEINLDNVPFGAQLDDVLGNSDFPYAVVDNSGGVGNNIYISLPARSYSLWVHNPSVALPAVLTTLEATLENDATHLYWETAQEENLSHFQIERSTNGVDFKAIGAHPAKGNSEIQQTYSYSDAQLPQASLIYYRLALVDNDGTTDFSPVRSVRQGHEPVKFWPNPVAEAVFYKGAPAGSLLEVYDVNGRLAQRYEMNESSDSISTANWTPGMYFIRVVDEGRLVYSQRLVKSD